jgi:hypothetical protein
MIQVPPMLEQHRHLPQQNGLTVPFITAYDETAGRYRFGVNEVKTTMRCLAGRLCGMCGKPLSEVMVLMISDENFPMKATPEPGLHVWCAWYASRACPMLNGSMRHYSPPVPDDVMGCGFIMTPGRGRRQNTTATPAPAWYQLWVRGDYTVGLDGKTGLLSWLVWKGMEEVRLVKLREAADHGTQ